MHITKTLKSWMAALLAGTIILLFASCAVPGDPDQNLISSQETEERIVNFFSPMEKIDPDAENVARSASDLTISMAEEQLGVTLAYKTYTAENYQDKTYDDVCLDRARSDMDDLYLLNPYTGGRGQADGLIRLGLRPKSA